MFVKNFSRILVASFQIWCDGVLRQKDKNWVSVPILLEGTLHHIAREKRRVM